MKTQTELTTFARAYLLAAFWTNDDDAPSGQYETSGRFEILLPKLAPEAMESAAKDCAKFQGDNAVLLKAIDLSDDQAGHDFWLTRNHHGSGFWDRDGDERVLRLLTDAAHLFGEVDLYIGDNGQYYFSR